MASYHPHWVRRCENEIEKMLKQHLIGPIYAESKRLGARAKMTEYDVVRGGLMYTRTIKLEIGRLVSIVLTVKGYDLTVTELTGLVTYDAARGQASFGLVSPIGKVIHRAAATFQEARTAKEPPPEDEGWEEDEEVEEAGHARIPARAPSFPMHAVEEAEVAPKVKAKVPRDELLSALKHLGYKQAEAALRCQQAIDKAPPGATLEELVKHALSKA